MHLDQLDSYYTPNNIIKKNICKEYQDVFVNNRCKLVFRQKEHKHDYNSTRENMHVSPGGYLGNDYSCYFVRKVITHCDSSKALEVLVKWAKQ